MWEEGRTKPLKVICFKEVKGLILNLLEYAYKGFPDKFQFKIEFMEVDENSKIKLNEFKLSFAPNTHSAPDLAIKVDDGKNRVCYSGDGMFTDKSAKMYNGSDLVIHESYLYDEKKIGHASIVDLIQLIKDSDIKCIALTHLQRDFRKEKLSFVKKQISKEKVNIIVPEPFQEYEF